MAHVSLLARTNDGSGKFPFVKVQFTKNHRPIAIEGATYYLRASGGDRRPIRVGRDIDVAYAALHNSEPGKIVAPTLSVEGPTQATERVTIQGAAKKYIERSLVGLAQDLPRLPIVREPVSLFLQENVP
jgi:hypothetical protein